MVDFLIRKIIATAITLYLVATCTFFLIRLLPGGPFDSEKQLPQAIILNLKKKYHLDKPIWYQYFSYLDRLAHLDLGISYKYSDRQVSEILSQALPVSISLGIPALTISIILGVFLGLISAVNRGKPIDSLIMMMATCAISIPTFVFGILLMYFLGLKLQILPVGLWESPYHAILPIITLSLAPTANIARLSRASILDNLNKEYVQVARAFGISNTEILTKHVLYNSLITILTIIGPMTALLLTGSFVVEFIFGIPGMGKFFITAVSNRDYDLVIGTTIVFSIILILSNTIIDIMYRLIDNRLLD